MKRMMSFEIVENCSQCVAAHWSRINGRFHCYKFDMEVPERGRPQICIDGDFDPEEVHKLKSHADKDEAELAALGKISEVRKERLEKVENERTYFCDKYTDSKMELERAELERSTAIREAYDLRAKLAALGKDARFIAEVADEQINSIEIDQVITRILEATKEGK
jgi:hypothetical protein